MAEWKSENTALVADADAETLEAKLARAELDIEQIRKEVQQLSSSLTTFSARWRAAITPRSVEFSAEANARLGESPWVKLFAIASLAWLAGRMLRR